MAALTVQTFNIDGNAITLGAAGAGGDTFANDSRETTFLVVNNASGGDLTVTFTAQVSTVTTSRFGVLPVSNKAVVVSNGTMEFIGPFDRDLYNNSSGAVAVSYSTTSSVTVAAVKFPS